MSFAAEIQNYSYCKPRVQIFPGNYNNTDNNFKRILETLTYFVFRLLILIYPFIPINFQEHRSFSFLFYQSVPPFIFRLFHSVTDISQANTSLALLQVRTESITKLITSAQLSSKIQYGHKFTIVDLHLHQSCHRDQDQLHMVSFLLQW